MLKFTQSISYSIIQQLLLLFVYPYDCNFDIYYNFTIEMNKNNKTYYGIRTQVETPQQIINNTQQELIQYIEHINTKIQKRIQKNEANFIVAFQNHIKKIQDQLSALKNKQQVEERKYESNKAIIHLARQVSLFRQQAMRLSNQLQDTLEQVQTVNRLLKYKQSQLKITESKLQQYMESNKRFQQQNNQIRSLLQELYSQKSQIHLKDNIKDKPDIKQKANKTCMQLTDHSNFQCSNSFTKQLNRAQYALNNKLLGKYQFQITNSLHTLTPKNLSNTARRTGIQKQRSLRNLSIQHPSPKASDSQKKQSIFALKLACKQTKEKLQKSFHKDQKLKLIQQLINDQILLGMISMELSVQKKNKQKIPVNYISSDIMMKLNKYVSDPNVDSIKNIKKNNKINQQKLALKNRHHVLNIQSQRAIFQEKLQFTTM